MILKPFLENSEKFLIVGHSRPDGDCFGAGLSLLHVIEKFGKKADFVCDSPLPAQYSFLKDFGRVNNPASKGYDAVISVDCGDENRMGKYAALLKNLRSLNIDHHHTNNNFAAVNVVKKDASSTCEILSDIYLDEGFMDDVAADYLFVGLSTDTGHFMHSNTTEKVFTLAAKLINYGADNYGAVTKLYRSVTVNKTALIGAAIRSMRFYNDNSVCIITVTSQMLKDCGCTINDTEGLIDFAVNIGSVQAAACISQYSDNGYKVSFRSKNTDISAAAAVFGGGGHKHAAGCVVFGYLEDVVDKVKKAITDGMD